MLAQASVAGSNGGPAAVPSSASDDVTRAASNGSSPAVDGSGSIIVRISDTGGHYGDGSHRYQDIAQNYAFLINAVKGRRKPKHI